MSEEWCPAYPTASDADLVAVLGSGLCRPSQNMKATYLRRRAGGAAGFGNRLPTDFTCHGRGYGAMLARALVCKTAAANLSCRNYAIMASRVPRDGVIYARRKRRGPRIGAHAQPQAPDMAGGLKAADLLQTA